MSEKKREIKSFDPTNYVAKLYTPNVMDQVEYMRKLYTANLITATDYQDYLKLRLNEVFSSEEQALIWDKIKRWEKEKEEWY